MCITTYCPISFIFTVLKARNESGLGPGFILRQGIPKGLPVGRGRQESLGGAAVGTQAFLSSPRGSKGTPLAQSGCFGCEALKIALLS